jgi:preprotein translocase YajC subunit
MNAAEVGFLVIVAIIIAFYLIVLRPPHHDQKRQREDIKKLEVGDEVLTTSGFLATVKDVYVPPTGPVQVVLDFGNGVVIHAVATAIQQRVAAGQTRLRVGDESLVGDQTEGS